MKYVSIAACCLVVAVVALSMQQSVAVYPDDIDGPPTHATPNYTDAALSWGTDAGQPRIGLNVVGLNAIALNEVGDRSSKPVK